MKLLISLLLLLPHLLWASHRPIVIRYYHPDEAEKILVLLQDTYNIPSDFISLEMSPNPCARLRENISWHLCVDANGDLFEVFADVAFIKQTLRIFL